MLSFVLSFIGFVVLMVKMKQAQSDEELSLVIADLWCRYLVVYRVTPSPIRIASCCA